MAESCRCWLCARIEIAARRVDVDDPVALAMVFGVGPVRRLLPHADPRGAVPLTSKQAESWQVAWRWAVGELPMLPAGERIGATTAEWPPTSETAGRSSVSRYMRS